MSTKIDISNWQTLDAVVYLLQAYKADRHHVYCEFKGHRLDSDTVTMDSAYLEVCGKTKEEYEKEVDSIFEDIATEKKNRETREQRYKRKVAESNHGEPVEISQDVVVEGLKYICEHQDATQDELIDALLELGCNFTLADIRREVERTNYRNDINYGLRHGDLLVGASIICNMRDSEFGRGYGKQFLYKDGAVSIYNYIRKATGDDSYTKAYVDSLTKGKHR